jgi:sulfite exporter TauE/SafE
MEFLSGLTIAFITGLVSSFGHCLGMCGGIVAIYSARQAAVATAEGSKPSVIMRVGNLVPVHIGRIMTYTFMGALVGFAGALLNEAGGMAGWQGAFSILVGVLMAVVALSLMGVLPSFESILASVTGKIAPMQKMRGLFGKQNVWATVAIGILWGFLPCGLVFAMLVVASSAQSVAGGALTMLAFGLGTIPTLLGFGLAANMISPSLRGRLQLFAGLLILLFAIQTVLRGLAVMSIIPSLNIGEMMLW